MMTEQTEFDFGVPTSVLNNADDFLELPDEVARRRAEREASKPEPKVIPEVKGQAKAAAAAEVAEEIVGLPFEYDGETYKVPSIDDWDLDIFENQEDGKLVTLVRNLLGPVQYDRFKTEADPDRAPGSRRKKKRTIKELLEILEAATKASGTNTGE